MAQGLLGICNRFEQGHAVFLAKGLGNFARDDLLERRHVNDFNDLHTGLLQLGDHLARVRCIEAALVLGRFACASTMMVWKLAGRLSNLALFMARMMGE